MHGIKQLATFLSLTALVCLSFSSSSSSSSVLATENVSFSQRNLLDYSRSAAEKSYAAQVALNSLGSTWSAGTELAAASVQSVKRHCKNKSKKHHKKKKHHKHHHHHKHHNGGGSSNGSSSSQETNNDDQASDETCQADDTTTKATSSTTDNVKVNDAKKSTAKNSDSTTTNVKTNEDIKDDSSDTIVTSSSGTGSYKRVQQNRGSSFWSGGSWDFWSYADPTHGQVKFASEQSAKSQGLIGIKDGAAFMRASNKDISGSNRPSVRFQSKQAYDSGLIIFDVAKMPVGCATWPALWTTKGDSWPMNGEIDVVEGVGYESTRNANQMTVHLGQNSPLSLKRRGLEKRASYTGKLMKGASNCNQWGGGSNSGCAFFDSNAHGPSWGTDFNNAGGGVWAMQFGNEQGVKIWFWGRQSGTLPDELSKANVSPDKLNPSSWGTPMANFQSNVINRMVKAQNIIMDITIGGDWAGNVPMDGKCKGKNLQQAIKKGSNYDDAEFIINGIDIYCKNGKC